MRHLVGLSAETETRIRKLIELGRVSDIDAFITTAVENQLKWESPEDFRSKIGPEFENPFASERLWAIPPASVHTLSPPPIDRVELGPLWGQYYRFLPLKLLLRVIANLSIEDIPDRSSVNLHGVASAATFGDRLRKIDKKRKNGKGEKLSTTFPRGEGRKSEKSQSRFANQYVGYRRSSDRRMTGMASKLLLVNLRDDLTESIGITKYGLEFSLLPNPVIDEGIYETALSEKEVMFLVQHIEAHVADEAIHMKWLLNGIKDQPLTRSQLNKHMESFYASKRWFGSTKSWTDKVMETMRAGLVSRLLEMGLVQAAWSGRSVLYSLTDRGGYYLQTKQDTQVVLRKPEQDIGLVEGS